MAILDQQVHGRDHRAVRAPEHGRVIADAHQLRATRRCQLPYGGDQAKFSQVSDGNGSLQPVLSVARPRRRTRQARVAGRLPGT